MKKNNFYFPLLVVYMPVTPGELDIAITSIKHLVENSKRLEKFAVVGQRYLLDELEKASERDSRLVYVETPCVDMSSGMIWQHMMEKFPECDLLRVTPGVSIPLFWDSTLQQSAYKEPDVGSVSPLCNGGNLFRLLNSPEAELEASQNLNLASAIIRRLKVNKVFQVPVFSPNIVFIKKNVLVDVFTSASLNFKKLDDSKLAEMIYHHGFINIISGDIYANNLNKGIDEIYKEIDKKTDVGLINAAHPASVLRHLATDALTRNNLIDTCQPVQLHIMHSWGGGLHKWVSDYCEEDKAKRNLVLKSIGDWDAFGKRLALYEHPDAKEPIAYWDLGTPVQAVDLKNIQYREILKSIIEQYGVDTLWVSSLIGHSLDVLDFDVKTGFICHDYFPICPAINIYFDGICSTCDESRMASCFDKNEHNRFFKNDSTKEWFAVRKTFVNYVLSNNINLVVPTPSIKDYLVSLQPELGVADFRVISHGKERNLSVVPKIESEKSLEEFRVVVLGELAPHKGQDLLLNIIDYLPQNIQIYLLGCGQSCKCFKGNKNIKIVEKYSHDELPEIMVKINPDIGLLLSVWPETFSYTLSELMEFGIPPVATELGAFKDRIIDGENGFLFKPEPDQLLVLLNRLCKDKSLINKVKENLINFDGRKPDEMIGDYHQLATDCFFNSLSLRCVGNYESLQENQSGLMLSNNIDIAVKEFRDFLKGKIIQTNQLKAYLKCVAIFFVEIWLVFPRLVVRVNKIFWK